jgi:hypothetical protein
MIEGAIGMKTTFLKARPTGWQLAGQRAFALWLSLAVVLGSVRFEISAQTQTVPAGTVLTLEMDTRLDSKRTRSSDRFTARVTEPVTNDDGRVLIPAESVVHGYARSVVRAQYRRRSGIIEITFDKLVLPDGREFPLSGTLTSADTRERQRIDEEGRIKARTGVMRHVVFIGGGAGTGAMIGVITGSAVLGAGIGAGVGAAAAYLAKGKEAVVEEGARIGVSLNQPLNLSPARSATPAPAVSQKQEPKKPPMKEKPAPPQPAEPDPNPPVEPGTNPPGNRPGNPPQDTSTLVPVSNFQVQRGTDGSVGLVITAETSTAGWRLRTTHATDRELLEIWLHGERPKGMAAQVISYPAITVTVPDAARVLRRVIIHGANGDFTGEIPAQ